MDRRTVLALFAGATVARPIAGHAQRKALPTIGFLNSQSPTSWQRLLAAFHRGLKEHDLVEGETVSIEYRWAEGRSDRLPALAADLVARKVNVIVATGGPDPALAARAATATIPVVFISGADPIKTGLIESLARPGGNITGFALFTSLLGPKRFEYLRELVPGGGTIAVLLNPDNSYSGDQLRELEAAAATLGERLHVMRASDVREIGDAFNGIAPINVRALFVASDAFYFAHPSLIVDLAARHKVPAIYDARVFTEAGGLASYGTDFADVYRLSGVYASRILKGEKPADLSVQQPTKFELVINAKTAKALGLTVPQNVLARADEVIE